MFGESRPQSRLGSSQEGLLKPQMGGESQVVTDNRKRVFSGVFGL